jgi:fibronectin-binding autotransporter adhesin
MKNLLTTLSSRRGTPGQTSFVGVSPVALRCRGSSLRLHALLLGIAALAPAAGAAAVTWDNDAATSNAQDGAGSWTVGGSTFWDGAANVATTNDLSSDIAPFGAGGTGGAVTVTSQSINGLVFDTTTGSGYTLSGGILTVGSSGVTASSGALATNVNSALVMGSSLSITNNSANLLTLGSTLTGGASVTQTLTVGGLGNTTLSGLLDDGAGGTLNLTKTGAGYFKLNGAATNIAGGLDIQGGTVGVVNDFLATGLTGSGTFENASNNDKWTTWTINSDQTFSGVFRNNDGVNTGLLGFIKNGTGTLTLSNSANNIRSNFTVNAGKVIVSGGTYGAQNQNGTTRTNLTAAVGSTAGVNGVLVNNGATFNYNNRNNAGAEVWRSTLSIGTNGTGAGALVMTSGSLSTNRQLGVGMANGAYGAMVQTGGTTTVGGFLAVAVGGANARGLVDFSGGTWTQAGPVTLGAGGIGVMNVSGSTVFSQTSTGDNGFWVGEGGTGILNVSGSSSLSIVAGNNGLQLGRGATGVGTVNLLGGTVTANAVYKGTGAGTLNFNGGTLAANTANAAFLTGLTNAYVNSGGGTIDNGGNNVTVGQALLAPTGNGVSAAGLTVGGGGFIAAPIVTISGGGGTGATAVASIDSNGNLTGITITNPGVNYTSVPTVTLSGGGIGNTGVIGGTASIGTNSSGGMTFSGAGITTLSGASTYAGNTTIGVGSTVALASTGSLANSANIIANGTFDVSAVTGFSIGAAQTLQGSGAVVGATTVNGTLAPGNSPGLLTFSSDLSLGGSSTSQFEINGTVRGSTHDAVDAGGALSYGGTMGLVFDAPISAGIYDLFGGFSGQSGAFIFVSVGGSFAEALSGSPAITGSGWSASSPTWSYAFDNASGDLTISAVPEPSAFAALAGLAGLGLVGARRRRR